MIYFTAHTFNCVCHCIRVMFRVLGMYNFGARLKILKVCNIVQRTWFLSYGGPSWLGWKKNVLKGFTWCDDVLVAKIGSTSQATKVHFDKILSV